jgi:hypothetical protein
VTTVSQSPTAAVTSPTMTQTPTTNPCTSTSDVSIMAKRHNSNSNILQQFIQFLLQLFLKLFQLLGNQTQQPTPSPTPTPQTVSPTPIGPTPTPNPCPSATPTTGVSPSTSPTTIVPTPTIFGTSPSPTPVTTNPSPTSSTVSANCAKGGSFLWSNLESCGWPGPNNTGPDMSQCPNGLTANGTSATGTITFSTANQVVSCEKITGNVDITAANVTLKNSTISANSGKTGEAANGTGAIKIEDGASAIIDHDSINGNDAVHACIWDQGNSMTATNNNCTGQNDGIFSWADTSFSQTTGDNFDIENNYLHGFTTATANGHIDGYQTEGANNGKIIHNTFDVSQDQDSDVAIWDSLKSSSNITVDNNLMAGGGFAVYSEDYSPSQANPVGGFTETNIMFTNNKFSTIHFPCVGSFGVWFDVSNAYNGAATDGWHRSGNVVLETGQNVDNGNPGTCN